MKQVTIRQAMQQVVDNPEMRTDDMISLPVHELVVRTLFEIANNATSDKKRSMAEANVARNLIFNRLVGRRRAGSHPATREKKVAVEFTDLTGGAIES
jgi:hypothetical protein